MATLGTLTAYKQSTGYKTGGTSTQFCDSVVLTLTAEQDTLSNTSVVSWALKGARHNGGGTGYTATIKRMVLTIDGQTPFNKTSDFTITATKSIGSGNLTINHNADGTKALNVSLAVEWALNVSKTSSTNISDTKTATYNLTQIPRGATITLGASSITIGATDSTISYSITKPNTAYYTETAFRINNVDIATRTNTSGTINYSSIANKMPNASTGTFTATTTTYTDSTKASVVGTSSASASVSITYAPSVTASASATSVAPTKSTSGAPSNGSTTITPSVTNRYSASTQSVRYTILDSNNPKISASSNANASILCPYGASQYTFRVKIDVTDSRGLTATATTNNISVVGYTLPTANINAYRCDSSNVASNAGTSSYISVTNPTNNAQIGIKIGTTSVNNNSRTDNLPISESRTYTITLTDNYGVAVLTKVVSASNVPLDLYQDSDGKVGVAFGTMATKDQVVSALNTFRFANKSDTSNALMGVRMPDINASFGVDLMISASTKNHGIYTRGYYDGTDYQADAKWMVYRDTSGAVMLKGNADTATNSTNAQYLNRVVSTTDATAYNLLFAGTGTAEVGTPYAPRTGNTMLRVITGANATTIVDTFLLIGNGTATGTTTARRGTLRLYGDGTYYANLRYTNNATKNTDLYLPATGGTLALEPIEASVTNAVTASTGTIASQTTKRYGNVVTLYLAFTNSSSVASGGDVFKGTINTTYKPSINRATGGSYYGAHALNGTIDNTGAIVVRNASTTAVTCSSTTYISFTYVI